MLKPATARLLPISRPRRQGCWGLSDRVAEQDNAPAGRGDVEIHVEVLRAGRVEDDIDTGRDQCRHLRGPIRAVDHDVLPTGGESRGRLGSTADGADGRSRT
jgi:hypothetical protein